VVSSAAFSLKTGVKKELRQKSILLQLLSTMFQAGALIELSGDVDTAFEIYYETYDIHELPPLH